MFFSRKKRDLKAAQRERERSRKRLESARELQEAIEQIHRENHFADAIIEGLKVRR